MRKAFFSTLAIAVLAMVAGSCNSGKQVDLKFNLTPGSEYIYTIQTTTSTDQKPMGQNVHSTQQMTMEMNYKVEEAKGDNRRITVSYDRLSMNMESPMGNVAYDSRDTAGSDPRLGVLSGMISKPFTIEVAPTGEIASVEGLSTIIGGLADTSTPEGMMAHEQLSQTFSDTAVRSLMRQFLDVFPGHPVGLGDTWKKSYVLDMPVMKLKVDNVYTLKSIEGNTAHVDIKAKINGEGSSNNPAMKSMLMSMSGEQTGSMSVDIPTGLVAESNVTLHLSGDMSLMGMKVPMTVESKVHSTARKK